MDGRVGSSLLENALRRKNDGFAEVLIKEEVISSNEEDDESIANETEKEKSDFKLVDITSIKKEVDSAVNAFSMEYDKVQADIQCESRKVDWPVNYSLSNSYQLEHHEETRYICKICNDVYTTDASLRAHMLIHTDNVTLTIGQESESESSIDSVLSDEDEESLVGDSLSDEDYDQGATQNSSEFDYEDCESWVNVTTTQSPFTSTCTKESTLSDLVVGQSVIDYFNLFISEDMWSVMVDETNSHAQSLKLKQNKPHSRINKWENTNVRELKRLFAIIITMGINVVPKLQLYWSKNTMYHNKFISNIMSRDRFLVLVRCLNFSNESLDKTDKLYKLRPFLNKLQHFFKLYLTPGEGTVMDESLISWRGQLSRNNSHKFGVKLYKICSAEGYVNNFQIYIGKGDTSSLETHALSVIKYLMDGLFHKGRTLYVDKFYTSVNIAEYVLSQGTHICGALRQKVKGVPRSLTMSKLRKGEIDGKMKGYVKVIKWVDKRQVLMITTKGNHDLALYATGQNVKGERVKKPNCVIEYNSAKRCVDYSAQMPNNIMLSKKLKWYRKVAIELIFGSIIINAWLLYCRKLNKKIPLLKFKELLAEELISEDVVVQPPKKTAKRVHTLKILENKTKRRRCKECYKKIRLVMSSREADKKVKRVYTYCEDCDESPPLCLPCFNERHSNMTM